MAQNSQDRTKALAQNLVVLLSSYEEELMALERQSPALGQLRRAVGIAIAEACYCISDDGSAIPEWFPPSDGQARRAG
jgi:hypothetical protein